MSADTATSKKRGKRANRIEPKSAWRKWCNARKLNPIIAGFDPDIMAFPGDTFDPSAANRAIEFIQECCHHVEGSAAGKLFILEKWQAAIVGCLFGWMRADGTRRFRKLFLYVPRGNGKTPLAAAIALYMLFADSEPGAQIYLIASRAEQASVAYRHARGMVENEPILNESAQIFKGQGHRAIILKSDPMAFIRVFPSDAAGIHGQMPHAVFGDELHAWPGTEARDVIKTAFAKSGRRQPLEAYLTTADYDRPSACNEEYAAACAVRDNGGNPNRPGYDNELLPVIYEATEEDDWTIESTWEKANPNIDVTVRRSSLSAYVRRAIEQPSLQSSFKRLHLNIRTTSQGIFIPLERWDQCQADGIVESLTHCPCYAGLDVSSKQDVTACVLVFPPHGERKKYVVIPYFWIPAANMRERENMDNVPYSSWVQSGYVFATPGNMIDEDSIESFIVNELRNKFIIKQLGFDSWNAMGLGERLRRHGIDAVEVPQTITRLTAGTKGLDDNVASGHLLHDGNPAMRWMLSCTETIGDKNQNVRPVKPDRKTGKRIDGVVAAVMALGLCLNSTAQSAPQIYF